MALLAAAAVASGLLLRRSLALAEGTAGPGDVCSTLFARGCDETLRDPLSRLGGIPLAGWGVLHFASILVLLLLGRLLGPSAGGATRPAAVLLGLAGLLGSLALSAAMVAGQVPLCPLCLVVHGLNLAGVGLLAWSCGPFRSVAGAWGRALAWLAGRPAGEPGAVPVRVLSLVATGLLAVVVYQWVLIEVDRAATRRREGGVERALAAYREALPVEIPLRGDEPALGPAKAPATLVVFSDAFCPSCRGFWSVLPAIARRYGADLRVVFKHFPLDPPCNAAAKGMMHPHACQAGLALEAARTLGKFWEYQAALEMPNPRQKEKEDPFAKAAKAVGLDEEAFRAACQAPESKTRLEADVALGLRLGVDATPTMFLNGRRLSDPNPKALQAILDEVLGRGEVADGHDGDDHDHDGDGPARSGR